MPLDWIKVKEKYNKDSISKTKTGKRFQISRVTSTAVYVDLLCGELQVRRKNLEKAVEIIESGGEIRGPADYRALVYDERPAYAWAILRDLGYVE